MELWFSDYHTEDVKLDIKIEKQLSVRIRISKE